MGERSIPAPSVISPYVASPNVVASDESYRLKVKFSFKQNHGKFVGLAPEARIALALVALLQGGSLAVVKTLVPGLLPETTAAIDIDKLTSEYVMPNDVFGKLLAASFVQVFANDIDRRFGRSIVFEHADAVVDESGVTIEAKGTFKSDSALERGKHGASRGKQRASVDVRKDDLKSKSSILSLLPKRFKSISASALVALGLVAHAIEQYAKVHEGVAVIFEDLKSITYTVVDVFAKLLRLDPSNVIF